MSTCRGSEVALVTRQFTVQRLTSCFITLTSLSPLVTATHCTNMEAIYHHPLKLILPCRYADAIGANAELLLSVTVSRTSESRRSHPTAHVARPSLKTQLRLKLHRARRQLVSDPDRRRSEVRRCRRSVSKYADIAHEVGMVEHVESLSTQIQLHPLRERDRMLEECRAVVERSPASCVSAEHYSVRHRTICGRAVIAAVRAARGDVVRQPCTDRCYAPETESPRQLEHPTRHQPMPLVEDGRAVFRLTRHTRIIRVLPGDVRIHIRKRMRPRIAH